MKNNFDTIDEMMFSILNKLQKSDFDVPTSRGVTSEILGSSFRLNNPRARISHTATRGTIFSGIGETLWYLAGSSDLDFIKYYIPKYVEESDDGESIKSAYGKRMFDFNDQINQIENIINLLKRKPTSRRAVVQIFSAKDLVKDTKEIPCTCSLQFVLRKGFLNMIVYMRSNDALYGLSHDIFAFTFIQEIVAKSLCKEVGWYQHNVGSLHLYEDRKEIAQRYLREGHPSTLFASMPEMPQKNLWRSIRTVLEAEYEIRENTNIKPTEWSGLDKYWRDIINMVYIHSLFKNKDANAVENFLELNEDFLYQNFVRSRLTKIKK